MLACLSRLEDCLCNGICIQGMNTYFYTRAEGGGGRGWQAQQWLQTTSVAFLPSSIHSAAIRFHPRRGPGYLNWRNNSHRGINTEDTNIEHEMWQNGTMAGCWTCLTSFVSHYLYCWQPLKCKIFSLEHSGVRTLLFVSIVLLGPNEILSLLTFHLNLLEFCFLPLMLILPLDSVCSAVFSLFTSFHCTYLPVSNQH